MPNHITSRLTITGEAAEVAKVFAFIKADEPDKDGSYRLMDLNKIVPMPEELDIESSTLVEDGADYLLGLSGNCLEVADFKQTSKYQRMAKMEKENPKMFEQAIELGRKKSHNIANYGHGDWYSWRISNWGTKWNAYSHHQVDKNTIEFQTAWNGIPQIIALIAEEFPTVFIEYKFADENAGYNVGHFKFHDGEIEDLSPEDDTPEAWELVFELGVRDREDYVQLPNGSWEYRNDE